MNLEFPLDMKAHLQVNEEGRTPQWDEVFFELFSECNLKLLSQDPQQGPDGWPYLMAEIVFEGQSNNETNNSTDSISDNQIIEPSQKLIRWLSQHGIGLVVNPRRTPYPDFVFSYGMLWSFVETGYFIRASSAKPSTGQIILESENQIKVGAPSEAFLPSYVRQILKDFFRDQSVFSSKVLMLSQDAGKNYDLCFSLESLGSPPEPEHHGILEALSWFVPPHYSLALISEKGLPDFSPL